MRIGAPLPKPDSPENWVNAVQSAGYTAAYCPVDNTADSPTIAAYATAAQNANIVIAEVGAWSNPISPDDQTRKTAIEHCQKQLALADEIGARCCVNIAGTRHPQKWDAFHPDNFLDDTFDLIVSTVQQIIDAVKPKRTFYTLETMPYIAPRTVADYKKLLTAIDREHFAVHLDLVNMIYAPEIYANIPALIEQIFAELGAHIKSCHIKDIIWGDGFPVPLQEVRPGLGTIDYRLLFKHIAKLDDVPAMLEHLPQDEYSIAFQHIQQFIP